MDQSYLTELDTEYRETSSKVSRLISRLKTAPDNELRGLVDEIKNELQNCSTSLKEMKQQIKSLDGSSRESWQNVMERYNNDYITNKQLYEKERETAQRKDVFGSDSYLSNLGDSSEQARMVGMQRDARKNTETLEEARRELIGTEKNAEDIQENLYEQRGKIEKIKANLIAGNTLLGRMG